MPLQTWMLKILLRKYQPSNLISFNKKAAFSGLFVIRKSLFNENHKMAASVILEQLYSSNDLDDCIRKMVKQHHRQDFKQELFLILYEKPSQLIIDLHKNKGLTYYVVRIILNLVNQKRNIYHKKYSDNTVIYDNDIVYQVPDESYPLEERQSREDRELVLVDHINNQLDDQFKTPYYRMLVHLVNEHGSQRAVSRLTGIPVSSICEAVKRVRNHLISI